MVDIVDTLPLTLSGDGRDSRDGDICSFQGPAIDCQRQHHIMDTYGYILWYLNGITANLLWIL